MFYRKFFAYFLLVLYGVPAAIGPHWHSHHHCALCDVACADLCDTDATSHQHNHRHSGHTHLEHSPAKDSAPHHCCSCNHPQHEQAKHASDTQGNTCPQAELQHQATTALIGQDEDCDSCAICHFYASSQLASLASASDENHSLVESIFSVSLGETQAVEHLHLARGPPPSCLCA